MTTGDAIVVAAMIFAPVFLYVKTKDSWNWRKILRRTGMAILVLIAIGVAVAYVDDFVSDRNRAAKIKKESEDWHKAIAAPAQCLREFCLGDSMPDVKYKMGVKPEVETDNTVEYSDTTGAYYFKFNDSSELTQFRTTSEYVCRASAYFTSDPLLQPLYSSEKARMDFGEFIAVHGANYKERFGKSDTSKYVSYVNKNIEAGFRRDVMFMCAVIAQ